MNEEINKFLDEHIDHYPDFVPERIRNKIHYGYHSDTDQIICHLGLIEEKESAYYKFMQLILENWNIKNKSIVEVSCGLIPILSSLLQSKCKKITAINKDFVFENYKNVETIRYDLNLKFDFTDYDLVVGFRPCTPTENIIDLCLSQRKDFAIYLCPCLPPAKDDKNFKSSEEYHNYLIEKIKNDKNVNLKVIRNHNLQDDMPVLICQRKKKAD